MLVSAHRVSREVIGVLNITEKAALGGLKETKKKRGITTHIYNVEIPLPSYISLI